MMPHPVISSDRVDAGNHHMALVLRMAFKDPFEDRLQATSYYNCICRFVTFRKFMRFGTVPNKTSERICHPRHRIEAKGSHLNKGQCTSRTLREMMF